MLAEKLGIETVAIYSSADETSFHVQIADFAAGFSKRQYLNMKSIFAACEITGAQAIHAGYDFLSGNSQFVKMFEVFGLKFIEPSSKAIAMLGDKQTVKRAGVPVMKVHKGYYKFGRGFFNC